jgi:hypothetical protein
MTSPDRHRRHVRDHEELIATVSPIRRRDDGSFVWTVTDGFGASTYRTSQAGDGIWQLIDDCDCSLGCDRCGAGTGWKQILGGGTAQFDLAGVSAETRRRRVVRRFAVARRR